MAELCQPAADEIARRRPPEMVMRLSRMGAFFPTRLSFMRTLIRRLAKAKTVITRRHWDMDENGYGRAVFSLELGGRDYALVAFSNALDPEMRTDRVIAEAWDAAFVLYDGLPTVAELDRLQAHAPKQEAGRFSDKELVLSRANKSLRLFSHVVDALASGKQPDADQIAQTGYLMRTTAVYGNGKFGISDRSKIADRPELQGPFQAEMLTVYLIRHFTHELVQHIAEARNPHAAKLSATNRRYLGIGNSTGLGMAPFLVTHPVLLNNWMLVRETALSRVRGLETASTEQQKRLKALAVRVVDHITQWKVADAAYTKRINHLKSEWQEIVQVLAQSGLVRDKYPFEAVYRLGEGKSLDCQELLVGLLLEVCGPIIDDLEDCMDSSVDARLNPSATLGMLKQTLEAEFRWIENCDVTSEKGQAQFWYESEEKLEPRLGLRYAEDGADKERPLDIARQAVQLKQAIFDLPDDMLVATFLLQAPQYRYIVRRIQTATWAPYGEIQDNLIDLDCLPIDMLRCKLSFFGAAKFDPKSDKWTRITLYAGAPLAEELCQDDNDTADSVSINPDDWWLPVLKEA